MNIFHIVLGLERGGAELMLTRLATIQQANLHTRVTVISLTAASSLKIELENNGVRVINLNLIGVSNIISTIYRLIKVLKKERPDIVQTWMYHADFIGGVSARLAGIKNIIWCVRSTDITKGGSKLTILIRKLLAKFSGVLPSKIIYAAHCSRKVHEDLGYNRAIGVVIPNGYQLEDIRRITKSKAEIRNEINVSETDVLITSVGRFHPVKDHRTFIQACIKVQEFDSSIKFLLIGRGNDSNNKELQRLINRSAYPERFFLLGERRDVNLLLNASNIFCLHSVTEGFPNVLAEAMALAIPAITTDVGDSAYLLGEPSYVVPPADPSALAEALIKLINLDDVSLINYSNRIRERIDVNFCLSKIYTIYLQEYNELMRRNS